MNIILHITRNKTGIWHQSILYAVQAAGMLHL